MGWLIFHLHVSRSNWAGHTIPLIGSLKSPHNVSSTIEAGQILQVIGYVEGVTEFQLWCRRKLMRDKRGSNAIPNLELEFYE